MNENNTKRLMNVKELSDYLSMPIGTIYTYTSTKKIPGVIKLGRALRFDKAEIDKWVNESRGAS